MDDEDKSNVFLGSLAPGQVPDEVAFKERVQISAANAPLDLQSTKLRLATRGAPKAKSLASKCWTGFWCLVPDVVEDAGGIATRGALKAVVNGVTILQSALSFDLPKLRDEIRAMFTSALPSDLSRFEYNPDTGKLPGRLTAREMIYCARLSLLSYLTREVTFDKFLPEERENEILSPLFDESMLPQIHRVTLIDNVMSLFEREATVKNGAANAQYGYSKGIAHGLNLMNLTLEYLFDINQNQGFIGKSTDFEKNGGDLIIAFQGTVERKDFVTSFRGLSTPFEPLFDRNNAGTCSCLQGTMFGCCLGESPAQKAARNNYKPWGRVHVGFYEAFLSLRPTIQAVLENLLKNVIPDKKPVRIVVTGHSLGGALATLCTAWLMQWFRYVFPGGFPENFRVLSITFGQPKVGDDDFVAAVDNDEWTNWSPERNAKFKTYRIFTPVDPIVTTPPVALGYRHCYAMCMLNRGQMYFLPQSMGNKVDTTAVGTSQKKSIYVVSLN
jgi:hypothetical protein